MSIAHVPINPPGARQERELIPSDSPLAPFVSVNPGRMHGEPCFAGTRVPVQTLIDYLEVDGGLGVSWGAFRTFRARPRWR
jgi:hypothetical protein